MLWTRLILTRSKRYRTYRHRGISCRGVFLTQTDGAVEKRGAAEDAHGRPCPRHQRHPGASR